MVKHAGNINMYYLNKMYNGRFGNDEEFHCGQSDFFSVAFEPDEHIVDGIQRAIGIQVRGCVPPKFGVFACFVIM